MGVRGLMTFLEEYCPNGYSDIRIADLVEECRLATGRRQEIVVDGNACYSMWTDGLDWTIGLPVGEIKSRLKRFVDAFQGIGADLVFFFDGLTPWKKRNTWLKRREKSMEKMVYVYKNLLERTPFSDLPSNLYIPPNMTNFVTYVLKHELNCKVYVAVRECDEEIVDYVQENGNSIIFTHDTDFIVSYIHSYVLSAKHFNCDEMTTRMYDRRALNEYLNLRADQLPYLAILAANDLVDQQSVRPLHFRLTGRRFKKNVPYKILMKALAQYINYDLPWHVSSNNHMRIISSDMFGSRLQTPFLRMAYKSYFPKRRTQILLDKILIRAEELMQNVILPVTAWGILSAYIYESNPVLEDYRVEWNYWACATITRPLRERLYGILLFEKRNVSRPVVEWCAENWWSYRQSVLVYPQYPSAHHPGLLALWNENLADTHYGHKWALFLEAVSPNIEDIEGWMSLPDDFVISTAVCHYLFEEEYLTKNELRALLVTLVLYESYNSNNGRQMWDGTPYLRARQISVTFSRTYSLMFTLFASCGYPVHLSKNIAHIKFEPMLFQEIYEKVYMKIKLGELCHGDMIAMEIFHQMNKIIYQSCSDLAYVD